MEAGPLGVHGGDGEFAKKHPVEDNRKDYEQGHVQTQNQETAAVAVEALAFNGCPGHASLFILKVNHNYR